MTGLQLDIKTLAYCTVLLALLMCAAMAALYRVSPRTRCLLDWSVAGFLFAVGYAGLILRPQLPAVLSPTVANVCIMAAHAFLLFGIQRQLQRKPSFPVAGVVLTAGLLLQLFVIDVDDARVRIPVISVPCIGFDLYAAWLLVVARDSEMSVVRRLAALVLGVYAATAALRTVLTVLQANIGFMADTPGNALLYSANILFIATFGGSAGIVVFRDQELALRRMARIDPLTGLFNRHSLAELAGREMQRVQRYGTALTIMVADVDLFKTINDRFGHTAGDAVLRHVARTLRACLRDNDIAFRIGGEEFLVVLPATGEDIAEQVAVRLCQQIEVAAIAAGPNTIQVTLSVGIAQCNSSDASWEDSFQRADAALYRAKQAGRNQVLRAPPGASATMTVS